MHLLSQIVRYTCLGLLVATGVSAETEEAVQSQPNETTVNRLPAGKRASWTLAEYTEMQEKRASETPQEWKHDPLKAIQKHLARASRPQLPKKSSAHTLMDPKAAQGAIYYVSTHTGVIHHPYYISPLGDQVELEDQSIWRVRLSDAYWTLHWGPAHVVVVSQNPELFSVYPFLLNNTTTGVSVAANLSLYLDPIFHTLYNYRVVDASPLLGLVWLQDGSCWSVTSWDSVRGWSIGDTVIIGSNIDWLSGQFSYILINADLLLYVRANCLD